MLFFLVTNWFFGVLVGVCFCSFVDVRMACLFICSPVFLWCAFVWVFGCFALILIQDSCQSLWILFMRSALVVD